MQSQLLFVTYFIVCYADMQKAMCDPGPDLVVCDEGHRIKNHQSNIHHALHKIRTRYHQYFIAHILVNILGFQLNV